MKKKLISIGLVGLLLGGCTTVAQQSEETEVASETNQARPSTNGIPVSVVTIEMCGRIREKEECLNGVYYLWGEVTENDIETVRFTRKDSTSANNIILLKDTDGCLANSPFGKKPDTTVEAMNIIYDINSIPTISINVELLDAEAREVEIDKAQQRFIRRQMYAVCEDWEIKREGFERNYERL